MGGGGLSSSGGGGYTEKGNNIANYKTKQIGSQLWMAENLDYNVEGSKCYNDDTANCTTYGRLYSWATAMGIDAKYNSELWGGSDVKHQGICPTGWHIPSYAEWITLVNYAGGDETAGTKLKATSGWNSFSGVPSGTDELGFTALPSGSFEGSSFGGLGQYSDWWSATEDNVHPDHAQMMYLRSRGEDVSWAIDFKGPLFSVRCLKDN